MVVVFLMEKKSDFISLFILTCIALQSTGFSKQAEGELISIYLVLVVSSHIHLGWIL